MLKKNTEKYRRPGFLLLVTRFVFSRFRDGMAGLYGYPFKTKRDGTQANHQGINGTQYIVGGGLCYLALPPQAPTAALERREAAEAASRT